MKISFDVDVRDPWEINLAIDTLRALPGFREPTTKPKDVDRDAEPPQHVCGKQGFGQQPADVCEACPSVEEKLIHSMEQAVEIAKSEPTPPKAVTTEDATVALKEYLKTHTVPDAVKILGEFGATKVPQLADTDRAAFVARLNGSTLEKSNS